MDSTLPKYLEAANGDGGAQGGTMARIDKGVEAHLEPREKIELTARGAIEGFTNWSNLGGTLAAIVALTVVRLARLGFWAGAATIVVVIVVAFMAMLMLVGRPMARRHDPPLTGPYVVVALTSRRLVILDRARGDEAGAVVAAYPRSAVSAVRHRSARLLRPHLLSFRAGDRRHAYEFPRAEDVADLADRLSR
jgi:hypothetical protein